MKKPQDEEFSLLSPQNSKITAKSSLPIVKKFEVMIFIEQEKITSLALPKLATGVGGLDWKDVHPLIVQHLGDLPIPIFIYTEYHKDQQAVEKGL